MARLLAAAMALAACGPGQERYYTSFKGKAPPEIASDKADWFNAADALTLAKLKGKVVWLEFSFIN